MSHQLSVYHIRGGEASASVASEDGIKLNLLSIMQDENVPSHLRITITKKSGC